MKRNVIATAVLAVGIALAVPGTASAVTADYEGEVASTTAGVGGVVTYASGNTGEAPGTAGTAGLTCNNVLATTKDIVVGGDGALGFTITLPTSATAGSACTLAVSVGAFSDSETITVVGAASDGGVSADDDGLAATGVDTTPYIWFGGGLLLLGAGFLTMVGIKRRNRSATDNS